MAFLGPFALLAVDYFYLVGDWRGKWIYEAGAKTEAVPALVGDVAPEKNWAGPTLLLVVADAFPDWRVTWPRLSAFLTERAAEMRNLLFGEFKLAGTWGLLEAFVEKLVEFLSERPPRLLLRAASFGLAILAMFTFEFFGALTQLFLAGCVYFLEAPIRAAKERLWAVWWEFWSPPITLPWLLLFAWLVPVAPARKSLTCEEFAWRFVDVYFLIFAYVIGLEKGICECFCQFL